MTDKEMAKLVSIAQENVSTLHYMVNWNIKDGEMKTGAKAKIDEALQELGYIKHKLTERTKKRHTKSKAAVEAHTLGREINNAKTGDTPYKVTISMAAAIDQFEILKEIADLDELKLENIKTTQQLISEDIKSSEGD